MKIKDVPDRSKIVCNGATAEVLSKGTMGTRVDVKSIPENSGLSLGFQVWSNETDVTPDCGIHTDPPNLQNAEVSSAKAIKLPLTLF